MAHRTDRGEFDRVESHPVEGDHVGDVHAGHGQDGVTESRTATAYYESLPARINAVLVALLLALEGLLGLRFLLAAFGANPASGFVDFVRDVSWPLVRPFDGAFANRTWDEGIIEVNTLLAMGVWLLAFLLVMALVNALMPRLYADRVTRHDRHVIEH